VNGNSGAASLAWGKKMEKTHKKGKSRDTTKPTQLDLEECCYTSSTDDDTMYNPSYEEVPSAPRRNPPPSPRRPPPPPYDPSPSFL
jgi:hypothetical protein